MRKIGPTDGRIAHSLSSELTSWTHAQASSPTRYLQLGTLLQLPPGEISPCPPGNSDPTRSIRPPPSLPRDPTIPSACLCPVQKRVSWGPPLLALLFPQVDSTHPRQLTENKLSTCLLPHWRERMALAKASRGFLHNIRWVS